MIHHLVTEGTIDERILQALKDKDRSQETLINAVKAQLKGGEPPATACGGNLAGGEVNRNKRSAQWAAASIEIADMEQPPALVCSLPAH